MLTWAWYWPESPLEGWVRELSPNSPEDVTEDPEDCPDFQGFRAISIVIAVFLVGLLTYMGISTGINYY